MIAFDEKLTAEIGLRLSDKCRAEIKIAGTLTTRDLHNLIDVLRALPVEGAEVVISLPTIATSSTTNAPAVPRKVQP